MTLFEFTAKLKKMVLNKVDDDTILEYYDLYTSIASHKYKHIEDFFIDMFGKNTSRASVRLRPEYKSMLNTENIGTVIFLLRQYRNMSIKETAFASDIGEAHLSKIERLESEPTLPTIRKIAYALNVPMPVIIFMTITPKQVPKKNSNKYAEYSNVLKRIISETFEIETERFFNL